jgi:hypothetical protein
VNQQQLEDELLEPLYLSVPGSELDRMRKQMRHVFDIGYEDVPPEAFLVCLGDDYCCSVFSASWGVVEEDLRDPRWIRHFDRKTPQDLSSVVSLLYDKHNAREDADERFRDVEMHLLCVALMKLAKLHKPTNFSSKRRLMLLHLSYRRINGARANMFASMWKRSNNALQKG